MGSSPPLGTLKYLYVGTDHFDEDLTYYGEVIGAQMVWNFSAFGARVAAFRVALDPLLLIADHRPAPSCMPVFAVDDLDTTVKALKARGWQPTEGPFEIPDGPCYVFADRSGNQFAVFGNVRPNALEKSYKDPKNKRVIRPKRLTKA
jgi:predicted enzyme related to lactoylglutathione lyase